MGEMGEVEKAVVAEERVVGKERARIHIASHSLYNRIPTDKGCIESHDHRRHKYHPKGRCSRSLCTRALVPMDYGETADASAGVVMD